MSQVMKVLSNTLNSVTLDWKTFTNEPNEKYHLQIQDRFKQWITVYIGGRTEKEISDLSPGQCYHFRLGTFDSDGSEPHWCSVFAAVTKVELLSVSVLHRAIEIGNVTKAQKFLKTRQGMIDAFDIMGRPPLTLAAGLGDGPMVALLLTAGADVNLHSQGVGRTALMVACSRGDADITRQLVERGASWFIQDKNGCTALNYAVDASQSECLTEAIHGGADIESRDKQQFTPLMRAVMLECSTDIISQLAEQGANVNAHDRRNITCLMLAVLSGRAEVVQLLLDAGADPLARDIYNNTALEMAISGNKQEVVNLMK